MRRAPPAPPGSSAPSLVLAAAAPRACWMPNKEFPATVCPRGLSVCGSLSFSWKIETQESRAHWKGFRDRKLLLPVFQDCRFSRDPPNRPIGQAWPRQRVGEGGQRRAGSAGLHPGQGIELLQLGLEQPLVRQLGLVLGDQGRGERAAEGVLDHLVVLA